MPRGTAARRLVAAFLLGAAVGSAATVPQYGHRVESLLLVNGRLVQQLHEYRSRLERLQAAGGRPDARVVQEVTLDILWHDEAARLALAERLAPLAEELVGRDLERIDPYLLYALFDGREVAMEGRRYSLSVRAVVVAEQVTVVIAVSEQEPSTLEP